jgi:hypothetical protein
MIGCGMGDEAAKRIGEMLEKNGSLMKLNLCGEHSFIFHHVHMFFCLQIGTHGEVIESYMFTLVVCVVGLQGMGLEMKEPFELQRDWRRILH